MTIYSEGQFKNNTDITNFSFNDSDILAKDLFLNCKNLTFKKLPNVEIIPEYCFVNCKCCQHLKIPTSVKKIEECAFLNCRDISQITLPEGLEEIGDYAFEGTNIKEINLPLSLTKFNFTIFSDCKLLETIKVKTEEQKNKFKIFEQYYQIKIIQI